MSADRKAGIWGYVMEPTVSEVQWTGARDGNNLVSLVHDKLGLTTPGYSSCSEASKYSS